MNRSFEYAVVDAFTEEPYAGNPAGVVLDATGLADGQMAAIAREFNLSETAFVLPADVPDAAVRLRWFTPGAEVQMCGHATLAAVHAMTEAGRFAALKDSPEAILPVQTAGGVLSVRMEPIPGGGDHWLIWLDLPRPVLRKRSLNLDKVARLLGMTVDGLDESLPVMQTQDGDVLVFVQDHQTLHSIAPNFVELGAYQVRQRIRGFCMATVNTLAQSIQVQSRFFCPSVGVNEDPVTGSVHGPPGDVPGNQRVSAHAQPVGSGELRAVSRVGPGGPRAGHGHSEAGRRIRRLHSRAMRHHHARPA